jgi:hypothetical protein
VCIADDRGADQYKDARSNDGPDSKAGEIPGRQGLLQPMFRSVRVGEDSFDGFRAE